MSSPDPRHVIDDVLVGWLESPTAAATDCALVSGWVFSRTEPIVSMSARVGGAADALTIGIPRTDVYAVYADAPAAATAGFSGFVEFECRPSRWQPLEIWAVLASGTERRAFLWKPARFRPWLPLTKRWAALMPPDREQPSGSIDDLKHAHARQRATELEMFLACGSRLDFRSDKPRVSVVVVLWNRAELALGCLRALRQSPVPLQLILVDNASTDRMPALLRSIDGATVLRNQANLGFLAAANQGAAAASADHLLFLNSDAEVLPDCIEQLLACIEDDARIGAVGGKLIWPDGRLQEAGSIIWNDGSCEGYGRADDPFAAGYSFRRDIDFSSGALLLTRTSVFRQLGGFDERYRPAYYEDADYCVRLWQNGFRVTFEPRAVAVHMEFASSTSAASAIDLQQSNRARFLDRHRVWLTTQLPRSRGALTARSRPLERKRVLYIDDMLPDRAWGAGFPRAAALLESVLACGYGITVYTTKSADHLPRNDRRFRDVELVTGGSAGLAGFLESRGSSYDVVMVSRSHNMQFLKMAAGRDLRSLRRPVVYDAEAIGALREVLRADVLGTPLPEAEAARLLHAEVTLALGCRFVLAVNEIERRCFARAGVETMILSHVTPASSGGAPFSSRETILFVGAFTGNGPNEDAVDVLVNDVGPALERILACQPSLIVTGRGAAALRALYPRSRVSFTEGTETLDAVYERARVFLAPTRFAAGIPIKIIEAAARGVPVVCTPLLAEQLGWEPGRDLLTASAPEDLARCVAALYEDEELWNRVRMNALARVSAQHSAESFTNTVRALLAACS